MSNDRFKFRAWDGSKMLYENQQYGLLPQYQINDDCWTRFWEAKFRVQESFVLMQCTGLKDKEGRLIYEGDILEGISNNVFSKDEKSLYEVMWGIDSWHIKNTFFCLQELFNYTNDRIKVVGNIYETKT